MRKQSFDVILKTTPPRRARAWGEGLHRGGGVLVFFIQRSFRGRGGGQEGWKDHLHGVAEGEVGEVTAEEDPGEDHGALDLRTMGREGGTDCDGREFGLRRICTIQRLGGRA